MSTQFTTASVRAWKAGLAVLLLAVAAGCATERATSGEAGRAEALDAARDRLAEQLRDCTARYPYDPDDPTLPENGLGSNELEWRECAYEAARTYTSVNTSLAIDFATLIEQDREMTRALAAGEITRSERRERLEPLIADVHEKELQQIHALETDQARKDALARQITEGLRGLN